VKNTFCSSGGMVKRTSEVRRLDSCGFGVDVKWMEFGGGN